MKLQNHVAYFAALNAAKSEVQLHSIIARTLVALLMDAAPHDAYLLSNPQLRDSLVVAIIKDLGGCPMEALDATEAPTSSPVRRGISKWLAQGRERVANSVPLALADIALYQRQGQKIRDFIREKVEQTFENPPVVVMGHSLGGIACADLLVSEPHLSGQGKVKALITVGSPCSLLYETGTLQSLPHGSPLPPHFPAWFNVYDHYDFLSSVGSGVFPKRPDGTTGIEAIKVSNGGSLLGAHSAYWTNPQLWQVVQNAFAD